MEYEQMETFLTVAQTKSFSRSAEILHVAQTTISVRIQQLERSVGKKLFNRNTRSLELTESGHVLLPYVEKAMELIEEGKSVLDLANRFTGRLHIGGLNSLWNQSFSKILSTYIKAHPEVAIKVVNGHTDDIYSKLRDGILDIGFVSAPPTNKSFEVIPLYSEGIILAKSTSFDLKGETIKLSACSHLPFIHMDWGPPFSEWLEQETGGMKFLGVEVDSSNLLVELLKSSVGLGFVLKSLAQAYIEKGELEEVPYTSELPSPLKTIYLAYSKRKQDKVEIELFATFMKKMLHY
ncbi:LysR family transcriptional regulator [Sutcliffiella halmapala]|uniref:LysR family transcriptional regulator n=1 Tax=Sutcliffiella halmapala TaxID=79882 RepID=UPI001475A410|nr:LysR family transcriptional regulator [Sutcliffiella halmapala]